MTTNEPLLRAICADPSADDPRLMYADWLEEQEPIRVECPTCLSSGGAYMVQHFAPHGMVKCPTCEGVCTVLDDSNQLHAEFIKVQIKLAQKWSEETGECWQCNCARRSTQHTNGPCRCTPEWKTLRTREAELWRLPHWRRRPELSFQTQNSPTVLIEHWRNIAHSVDWQAMLTYQRGFPAVMACTKDHFVACARLAFSVCPITGVILTDAEPSNQNTWYSSHAVTNSWELTRNTIPHELYVSMNPKPLNLSVQHGSRHAAMKSLHDACLRFGRNVPSAVDTANAPA